MKNKLLVLPILLCLLTLNLQAQKKIKGYGKASYNGLTENVYLQNWWVLGPVKLEGTPNAVAQKAVFDKDAIKQVVVSAKKQLPKTKINNKEYEWALLSSNNGTIDFVKKFGQLNHAYCYALAEIQMDQDAKILLGVGSDDGIKVFVNGTLVHSNWVGRAAAPDQDVFEVELKKGSNQILVKVQNMVAGWSFMMRQPDVKRLNQALLNASSAGETHRVKQLLKNGCDINFIGKDGLDVYQKAFINGHEEIATYLKRNGAKTDRPLPSLDQFISSLFSEMDTGTKPGAAVLVSQKGKILYQNGFGYADVGNKVPITPDTKFRIASITKQFIASAILKLQEEGKISINDMLLKYIHDFPRGNEVKIHHLMTHTSGIYSYTNSPSLRDIMLSPITTEALIDSIKTYPFDFNPGEKYAYNNSAYFILGYIIEKITGKTLDEYLQETFFKPLKMFNSGIYDMNTVLENEAYGFIMNNEKVTKAPGIDMSWPGGAGAMYSTVKDLQLWNQALFSGKVLSDSSMQLAFAPIELNNGNKVDYYGFGWGFNKHKGLQFIGHSGGMPGVSTNLTHQPENNVTICVLTNFTPHKVWPGTKSMQIADFLLWEEILQKQKVTSFEVDENTLKSYTGKYDYGSGAILTVTYENNQLYAQLTGQAKHPIFPKSNNQFEWKVVTASIKFIANKEGNLTHAMHSQGGKTFKAKKIEE